MRVLWCSLLLSSTVLSLDPGGVCAQPAPAPPAVDKAKAKVAKQYVDAGLAAQSTGDYDTAITFYSKAFQLVPHPVLLFNMAQAHRLAGRVDEALRLYARYLEQDPRGAQAQTARDLIAEDAARKAEAERKIAEARREEARKADEARRADDARKADAARKAHDARARAERPQRRDADTTPTRAGSGQPESPPAAGRTLRLSGISTAAAGVVGIGIGIGFGVHGASLSSELSRPGVPYDPDKEQAGHRANTLQAVGLIGGTALVAAGAVLYWRGHVRAERRDGVVVAPLISDQAAGLVMAGFLP